MSARGATATPQVADANNCAERYVAARTAGDFAALEKLIAPDFRFAAEAGVLDREAFLARCRAGDFAASSKVASTVARDGEAAVRWRDAQGRTTRIEWLRLERAGIHAIDAFDVQRGFDAVRNPVLAGSGDEVEYACLVHQDDDAMLALDDGRYEAIVRRTLDWLQRLEASGRHVFSAGLQSVRSATTVQARNGRVSTIDGPFAETKEHLGGFTVLRARDLNEAMAIASALAEASGTSIEVRPLLKLDVVLADPLDRRLAAVLRANVPGR